MPKALLVIAPTVPTLPTPTWVVFPVSVIPPAKVFAPESRRFAPFLMAPFETNAEILSTPPFAPIVRVAPPRLKLPVIALVPNPLLSWPMLPPRVSVPAPVAMVMVCPTAFKPKLMAFTPVPLTVSLNPFKSMVPPPCGVNVEASGKTLFAPLRMMPVEVLFVREVFPV